MLRGGGNAVDAVCTATQVLEDSPRTNAGFGSSLTADGSTSTFSLSPYNITMEVFSSRGLAPKLTTSVSNTNFIYLHSSVFI